MNSLHYSVQFYAIKVICTADVCRFIEAARYKQREQNDIHHMKESRAELCCASLALCPLCICADEENVKKKSRDCNISAGS